MIRIKYGSPIVAVLSLLILSAFAPRASTVAPTAIPSAHYKGLSCGETKTLLEQKRAEKNALTREQNNAATGHAVGVFLVLLPVGSILGSDKEGELAEAQREVLALEGAVTINYRNS